MNSKEAVKQIKNHLLGILEIDAPELIHHYEIIFPIIEKDLDRLEELEKENQELRVKGKELLNALEIAKKYKKVIKILNEEPYILEFGLENFTYDKFDNTYYYELEIQGYDGLDFRNKIYVISKENYDLLKEVLGE